MSGFTELTDRQRCPVRLVLSALRKRGLTAAISDKGAIRAECKCGSRLAVIQTAQRPVSNSELDRIRDHLLRCACMR